MKSLVTLLIIIQAVGLTTACNNGSEIASDKLTYLVMLDRSQSMKIMPSVESYMDKITHDIGFDKDVYFGREVTWYIVAIDSNLVQRPAIITLNEGAGEWKDSFKKRQDFVIEKLAEVEYEIERVLAIPVKGSTSFYSTFSYYLSELSQLDGEKKISLTTDAIDNYIHSKTDHLESKQQMRTMYPDFKAYFNSFYKLDQIDFEGIEIEFINSYSGKFQSQAYESQLFFSEWLDSLNADHTVIQNI